MWIRGLGRSMRPLLNSGDSLLVRRCSNLEVLRGDLVLTRRSDGSPALHLAVAIQPLKTSSFLGHSDPESGLLLGRVQAVKRRARTFAFNSATRKLVWYLHRTIVLMRRVPFIRRLVRKTRKIRAPEWAGPLRRRVIGAVTVRSLKSADRDPLCVFAGDHLETSPEFLGRQLKSRWQTKGGAVGAFNSMGQLHGFAYLDEYREEGMNLEGYWIRALIVLPSARGLGIGSQLVNELCRLAKSRGILNAYADVDAENAASLKLFRSQGFTDAPSDLQVKLTSEWERQGLKRKWAVLQKTL